MACEVEYPLMSGAIDFLLHPSDQVVTEMTGLAHENGIDTSNGLGGVKAMMLPIETPAELMDRSRTQPIQYYQQTISTYLEALARAQIDSGLDVLEIGSERTHHKLRMIRDLCSSAYALNIFYHVPQDPESLFVTRVLADMSADIPFANESLDLVIVSATLHHAPDLEGCLKEMHRVLRRGARAIVINEPVEGLLKRLGGGVEPDRNEHIQEDPIRWQEWTKAIAASGLRPDFFIPQWFVGRISHSSRLPEKTRFGGLAKAIKPILNVPSIGESVRLAVRVPGWRLLGLPLNAVLWKDP